MASEFHTKDQSSEPPNQYSPPGVRKGLTKYGKRGNKRMSGVAVKPCETL